MTTSNKVTSTGRPATRGDADSVSGTRPLTAQPATAAARSAESSGLGTRPLASRLAEIVAVWAQSHYELVTTAAEFADGDEWFLDGAPTPGILVGFGG